MIFKFKEKPVVLDAFTVDSASYAAYAPKKAIEFAPNWWKTLPKISSGFVESLDRNMKSCPGFVSIYKTGYIFPHTSDIEVMVYKPDPFSDRSEIEQAQKYKPNEEVLFLKAADGSGNNFDNSHGLSQHNGWRTRTHLNLKINNTWYLSGKEYVKFLMAPVFYDDFQDDLYELASGIIDYKYNKSLNVNLMVKMDKEKQFLIPAGRPAFHLIPLTERNVEIKTHLIAPEEFNKEIKIYSSFNKFKGGYMKAVAQLEGKL